MNAFGLGLIIETAVALLLLLTIGYCFVLNQRLKKLHADRDELRAMVADLVRATELANRAIAGMKQTAAECDDQLRGRIAEAQEATQHIRLQVDQGRGVLGQVQEIVKAARKDSAPQVQPQPLRETGAQSAIETLNARGLGSQRHSAA